MALVVGSRIDIVSDVNAGAGFPNRIVQIDIDPLIVGQRRAVEVGIVADAARPCMRWPVRWKREGPGKAGLTSMVFASPDGAGCCNRRVRYYPLSRACVPPYRRTRSLSTT